jgi:bifunctional enzyme CysN/CysC
MDGDRDDAAQGQAVAIELDADVDVSPGAVLAKPDARPTVSRTLEARLVWLSETPYDSRASYLLRTATDLVPVSTLEIRALLDLESLSTHPSASCQVNDIAIAHLALGRAVALDKFADATETGSFMLVDAITGASIAGGVVASASATAAEARPDAFVLTRALLERGLCADLKDAPGAEQELRRRADEVALILRAAGVAVVIESSQDYSI